MVEKFEFPQYQMLALLQQHKAGLTIEGPVTRLDISRTAVNQHIASLERDGLIKKSVQKVKSGRAPRLDVSNHRRRDQSAS